MVDVEVVLWTGSRYGWSVFTAGRLEFWVQLPRQSPTQIKALWLAMGGGYLDDNQSLATYLEAGQRYMVRSHLE